MPLKKIVASDSAVKKKKKAMAIEIKKEIIDEHKRGVRVMEVTKATGHSVSTIYIILKKKEEIKKLDVDKGITITFKHC